MLPSELAVCARQPYLIKPFVQQPSQATRVDVDTVQCTIPLQTLASHSFVAALALSHSHPLPLVCHYRYELCNVYGLYVVDEGNVETHGFDPTFVHNELNPACR